MIYSLEGVLKVKLLFRRGGSLTASAVFDSELTTRELTETQRVVLFCPVSAEGNVWYARVR